MRGNFFRCGCEVFIEGKSVGGFESLDFRDTKDTISNTCTIKLPVYAIGMTARTSPEKRIRASLADINIKPGARIEVFCWYHDSEIMGQHFEKVRVFNGFIRQVIGGFPSTLICEDYAFVLRFGTIGKEWNTRTKLKDMIEYLLPISNKAFMDFREKNGFAPDGFNKLTFDSTNSAEVEFALKTFKNISPYDALEKLLRMFTLYGYVNDDGQVYFGLGVKDKTKRTVELATNTNVIGRDITPSNGQFVNYKVVVNGLMKDGTKYTYEYGDSEGQPERLFSPLNTKEGIKEFAHRVMARLQGDRNKGTISILLYPEVRMFDYIQYTDTLFSELSGGYYVTGRRVTCGKNGFVQQLTVTNEMFML